MNLDKEDTICAIATAPGGALGIIRISGPQAIENAGHIFHPANGKPLTAIEAGHVTFGQILNNEGTLIDEALATIFRSPHSYTGEDSVELSCHGSTYILQTTLQLLAHHGCRMARPGEYTERAFLNGKMDLSQAEAVADLIASTSAAAHRLAMNQMRGGYSHKLQALRERLIHITSLLELELDFSDHEDLEFADRHELQTLVKETKEEISLLTESFQLGNALKHGIPVSIIGETNAGKSTLLNALLNEERAIVSDIQGTTRDAIEATKNIGGLTFRFIDTAGIRKTNDKIENLGIDRTFQKMKQADIILWLLDLAQAENQFETLRKNILPLCQEKGLIIILNKIDQADSYTISQTKNNIEKRLNAEEIQKVRAILPLSAKTHENLDALETTLLKNTHASSFNEEKIIVTNHRHYEALTAALTALCRAENALATQIPADLISEDLRDCLHHLAEIIGEIHTDTILENIFKNFCIGK